MASKVSSRDFALLQEEVKCLRAKLSTTLNNQGGYGETITSPGSSVFPDSSFTNCTCVNVQVQYPNPTLPNCSTDDSGDDVSLGDFAGDFQNEPFGGNFVFDVVNGVFYLPPNETVYENRNIGLSDVSLRHGCKDVWWYKKKTPSQDNIILWRVGQSKILRTENAGRSGWNIKTPDAPTGYSLSNITFKQIISDPFRQNTFLVLAESEVHKKTFLIKTVDDGINWTWTELTTYNSVVKRLPIWMCINGNGGNLIWISTWGDDKLRMLKINNDPTPTISAEYNMGDASEWEMDNYFETISPISQVDTNTVWFYGRASNPQSLGLTHIFKTDNEGLSFQAIEQSWGLDWCGSFKASLEDDGNRNYYSVRNVR